MVEVCHDVLHPLPLLADEVLLRHLDVVELDEGRSRDDLARNLEATARDAWVVLERHDNERDAPGAGALRPCPDGHGGHVGHDAIGDPFLCSIDDKVFPIGGEVGFGRNIGDIGPGATNASEQLSASDAKGTQIRTLAR